MSKKATTAIFPKLIDIKVAAFPTHTQCIAFEKSVSDRTYSWFPIPYTAATVSDTPLKTPTACNGLVNVLLCSWKVQLLTHAQIAQKRAQRPPRGTSLSLVYVRTAMMIVVIDNSVHETPSNRGPDPPYAGPGEAIGNSFQEISLLSR